MLLEIILIVIGTLVIAIIHIFRKVPDALAHIPGPGSLYVKQNISHKTTKELAKEYGDVMRVRFFNRNFLIISSMESARESLIAKGSDFAGRPHIYTGKLISRGFKDIAFGQNQEWKALRTLVHKAVKVYGERGELLEAIVHGEGEELIKCFLGRNGEEFWPQLDIDLSIFNVINAILFETRFKKSDPNFIFVKSVIDTIFQNVGKVTIADVSPYFEFLSAWRFKPLIAAIEKLNTYVRGKISEHEESLDVNNLRDFVDYLLQQKQEYESSKLKLLTSDHYELAVIGVFSGGMETSSTSLGWTIALLGKHPDVQERAYCEIKEVLGNRLPSTKDKDKLSYIRAIIHESLRLHPPIPMGIPHVTTCDTSIKGMKIPKGVGVFYNLYAIGTDENNWDDPLEFKPERWLDADGKFNVSKENSFMAFSAGYRVCIGAALAKTELFLFTAMLIQRLVIVDPNPSEKLKCVDGSDAIWRPTEYHVSFKPRE